MDHRHPDVGIVNAERTAQIHRQKQLGGFNFWVLLFLRDLVPSCISHLPPLVCLWHHPVSSLAELLCECCHPPSLTQLLTCCG